jgi:hypothetical protein
VAPLAFHDLVALLDQALAFAIFALGSLLDVRAFFIGHDGLQNEVRPMDCDRLRARLALIAVTSSAPSLLRQKSIQDNQGHQPCENQQGLEGFSNHRPG